MARIKSLWGQIKTEADVIDGMCMGAVLLNQKSLKDIRQKRCWPPALWSEASGQLNG